jgi:hypothetical protein
MSGDPFGDASRTLVSAVKSAAAGEPELYYDGSKVVDLTGLAEHRANWEGFGAGDGDPSEDLGYDPAVVRTAAMADHTAHGLSEADQEPRSHLDDLLSEVSFEQAQEALEDAAERWDELSEEELEVAEWLTGKVLAVYEAADAQSQAEAAADEYNEAVVAEMVKMGEAGYDLDTLQQLIDKHGGDDSDPETLAAAFSALWEIGPGADDLEGMVRQTLRERRALADQ